MRNGFTLIELSIVLVIIGLIVGGVLVGQDLIRAAYARAQITQIEKFNTATNTFYGKYEALPGDMNNTTATQFGFITPRGQYICEGDGNGIIQGINTGSSNNPGNCDGIKQGGGETVMFWVDLSAVGLIEGGFSAGTPNNPPTVDIIGSDVGKYLPQAKLGQSAYVMVISGSYYTSNWMSTGVNYYSVAVVNAIPNASSYSDVGGPPNASAGMTVAQAYNIDKKVDDGMPQTGRLIAALTITYMDDGIPAFDSGGPLTPTTALAGSAATCYDNSSSTSGSPGNAGAERHYSMEMNGGAGFNCSLDWQFQ